MKKVLVILLALLCKAAYSQSGYTGAQLVSDCRLSISEYDARTRNGFSPDGSGCIGYLKGALDVTFLWQGAEEGIKGAMSPNSCASGKVSVELVARQIPIWAIEHPESEKESAIQLLYGMLSAKYPCSK